MNPYLKRYQDLLKTSDKEKHESAFLFQISVLGIEKPTMQFRFRIDRKWRVDFAWPKYKLAVECEGAIWRKDKFGNWAGAHSHPLNIERDIEKYNALAMEGYYLLRLTEKLIKSGDGSEMVKQFLSGENIKYNHNQMT